MNPDTISAEPEPLFICCFCLIFIDEVLTIFMTPILSLVTLFHSANVALKTLTKKLFLKPCKYLLPFSVAVKPSSSVFEVIRTILVFLRRDFK